MGAEVSASSLDVCLKMRSQKSPVGLVSEFSSVSERAPVPAGMALLDRKHLDRGGSSLRYSYCPSGHSCRILEGDVRR